MTDGNHSIYRYSWPYISIRVVLRMSSYRSAIFSSATYHSDFSWFEVVQNNLRSLPCCCMTESQVIAFGGDGRGSCHNGQSTH